MSNVLTNLTVSLDPKGAVSGLNRITSSFNRLISVSDKSTNSIKRQFTSLSKGLTNFNSLLVGFTSSILNSLSNIATRIAIVFGFSELVDATRKIEKFETTFLTFTGSLSAAQKEMSILLGVTNKFGVSFEAAIIPFAKFAAATQDMAKSDIRNIFTSFIEASSALQLNMQEVNGVFLALQQIASKGRVSMEELRLQLAERIPGTMIIAANSMKMTMMEFEKAARTGILNVNEFLLNFSKGITEKFGAAAALAADRLFAKMNRLNNAMLFFKDRLFSTGTTGKAYSDILDDITGKLNNNELATGAISNVLGEILTKIEKIISSISVNDINNWVTSFTVFAKTVGIAVTAVWDLAAALLNIATLGQGGMMLKLMRWPFDLAAGFDLARDGLLDFNDLMAASSFDELHTLVADVMTTDQELQKLRTTFSQLEKQLGELQSKISISEVGNIANTALGQEIIAMQALLFETENLIVEKEKLLGLDAMKMDPQLKDLNNQYDELRETINTLQSQLASGTEQRKYFGLFGPKLGDEINQLQDQLHTIQLLIDKRKEYFGTRFDDSGKEIDIPTKVTQPPSMKELEHAAKFIEKNNMLMERGYDSLLSKHDRTIKKITDSYERFQTTVQSYVSKDPNIIGILTQEEADRYISEMKVFTDTMLTHARSVEETSSELKAFNSALQTAKDSVLPEYEAGLNKINNTYDKLILLAKTAAKEEKWSPETLKTQIDTIEKLKETVISAYNQENSAINKKDLAYLTLYNNFGEITSNTYDLIYTQYEKDRDIFIKITGDKELAYKVFTDRVNKLSDEMYDPKIDLSNIEQAYIDLYSKTGSLNSEAYNIMYKQYEADRDNFIRITNDKELAYKIFADDINKLNSELHTSKIDLSSVERAYVDLYNKTEIMSSTTYDVLYRQYEVDRDNFIKLTSDKELAYRVFTDNIEELDKKKFKSDLGPIEQAYIDLYDKTGLLTRTAYDINYTLYEKDRDKFINVTGDKELAYKIFTDKINELSDDLFSPVLNLNRIEQAYTDLYSKTGLISTTAYNALREQYIYDRDNFIAITGDKVIAYELFNSKLKDLDTDMLMQRKTTVDSWSQITDSMAEGTENYSDSTLDVMSQIEQASTDVFKNMTEALSNFCITGKISFGDFANAIIKDIMRIYIQSQITGVFAKGFSDLFNSSAPPAPGGSGGGGAASSGTMIAYSAKGNVYNSPSLSAYSNNIVDTPTMFAFAKGQGIMGEAGPEAIMPLTRLPSGDLGVKADSNVSKQPMEIHIHEAPGTTARTEESEDGTQLNIIIEQVEQAMSGRMSRGTGLAPFMDNRYARTY